MKLDNKGFTLVELLAVLVILIAISSIAIPTISSSLDRNKKKQNDAKAKLVVSAAELYITDKKNNVNFDADHCFVMVSDLVREDYFDEDEDIPGDTCVKYDISERTFSYVKDKSACVNSLSCVGLME